MVLYCLDRTAHEPFVKAVDEMGDLRCVFCFPIRRDDTDMYWSYPDADTQISYDDASRTATDYVSGVGTARAYTADEAARADQRAAYAAAAAAQTDYDRAVGLQAAPDELAAWQAASLAAEGIADGDPWRQPVGAGDAYPLGAVVSHAGGTWESLVAANVWEPGVANWRATGAGIPDWVQPTGATDAYAAGDVVRHDGLVWQSDLDANVWEPGVYGWTEIPDPEGG